LVINGRCLKRKISGVERYAREIVVRLPATVDLVEPPGGRQGMRGHLWEQVVLPSLVGSELLWSPANTGPVLASNQIVTIHDTNAIEHPEWFKPRVAAWYRIFLPLLAHRARKVLTVSQYSRQRLIEVLSLAPERVDVIYPGVNPKQFHPVSSREQAEYRNRAGLNQPYLLFVGSPRRGKNLGRLIQAWKQVVAEFPLVELAIAGSAGPVFKKFDLESQVERLKWLGFVAESDLAALYSGALALIFPSLDEGFGLPALEAMACGLPVIAANAGALPEVVGEAAVLVNPFEVDSLAEVICRVLSDGNLRLELQKRGLKRSAFFSWEQAAQMVYQEALDLEPKRV
jgi:glycosyltransferase involved in cell wall biosynthesis